MRTALILTVVVSAFIGIGSARAETYENDWRAGYTTLIHDGKAVQTAASDAQPTSSSEVVYESDYRAGYTTLLRTGKSTGSASSQASSNSEVVYSSDYRAGYTGFIRGGNHTGANHAVKTVNGAVANGCQTSCGSGKCH